MSIGRKLINLFRLNPSKKALGRIGGAGLFKPYWGLCFKALEAGVVVRMGKVGTPTMPSISYSRDGLSWRPFVIGTTEIMLDKEGSKVWFKATTANEYVNSESLSYVYFDISGRAAASGNIMSLLDGKTRLTSISTAYCFYRLFHSCDTLVSAPELTATALASNCYQEMFYGCGMLHSVKVAFTDWNSVGGSTTDWLYGVSPMGRLECPATLDTSTRGASTVPSGWTVVKPPYWGLTFTANESNVTVNMTKTGSPDAVYLEYSTDLNSWTAFDADGGTTPITLTNIGDKVYFRAGSSGNTGISKDVSKYRRFTFTDSVSASGNIMSLLAQKEEDWSSVQMGNYCFCRLFSNCSSLTVAPELPATTLASDCYTIMFYGCTSLTTAPELPATTLADYCYGGMFSNCTSLTTAPKLPATTLMGNCYTEMFADCTSLTTAPELPATTLATYCYGYMFQGCTSLTTAPKLPATTLAEACYSGMFQECTSLTSAPELPATTLAEVCYFGMFLGCTSLTTAPELPATTLASDCYQIMFLGCTQLSSVKVAFTDWNSAGGSTTGWLDGVSGAGTFECPKGLDTSTRGESTVPSGWTVVNPPYWGLTFTAGEPNVTVNMTKNGSPDAVSLEYCPGSADYADDGNWVTFDADGGTTPITLTNAGDKVYFRAGSSGNTAISKSTSAHRKFTLSGSAGASGNIMSLLTQNGSDWQSVQMGNYCFCKLFSACSDLASAPELPATTLASDCYYGMFDGCSSLIAAPELPATTLATYCYTTMFYGCSSLTTAPELPATTLANFCYEHMFAGCTSLATAPELPITTLVRDCYYGMFQGCTSLTSAPELPATTLALGCYGYMFRGCTSLTTAPTLPATTLADHCYFGMFSNCDSLTTPPELPATTLADYCYYYMFRGCTSLTTAPKLPATTLAGNCYEAMFAGCSYLKTAPELPATTLTIGCYRNMFYGCASLTTAPELPATTLANSCYSYMFQGCTHLSSVNVAFTDWNASASSTSNWLANVAAIGTFECPKGLSISTRGASTVPSGWTIERSPFWGLTFTANEPNVTVNMTKKGSPDAASLEYSTDANTWTAFDADGGTTPITLANTGDKVYFRAGSSGNTGISKDVSKYRRFTFTGSVSASGNIMSLLTRNESDWQTVQMGNYCFCRLFSNCSSLTTAPELPASTLAEGCYSDMFSGCTSLTATPALPATTLADFCYGNMFSGCTSLTTAPVLPAITLADSCYSNMFYGCTSLTTAPELPATTLASSCYVGMFQGCTSLTSAPELPATTLADFCYGYMFQGCTSLTAAPALHATTLSDYCYGSMFQGCTSLTAAPALPAITLASGCYNGMFINCTSLTVAPVLPATILPSSCYNLMFYNCTSVARISVGFTSWPSGSIGNWVNGVSLTGIFHCPETLGTQATITRGTSYCPSGWTVENGYWGLCFTATTGNAVIGMTRTGNPSALTLLYSTDTFQWYPFIPDETSVILPHSGDKVWIKADKGGNAAFARSDLDYHRFTIKGLVSASGSIMSLLDGETDTTALAAPFTFTRLFYGCDSLTSAPRIKALNATPYCYGKMFYGCTSLEGITVDFESWSNAEGAYSGWMYGVKTLGTFTCKAALGDNATIERGPNRCPGGWTVVNE